MKRGTRWTNLEIETLVRLLIKGYSSKEIAEILQRTNYSVINKLHMLRKQAVEENKTIEEIAKVKIYTVAPSIKKTIDKTIEKLEKNKIYKVLNYNFIYRPQVKLMQYKYQTKDVLVFKSMKGKYIETYRKLDLYNKDLVIERR